MLLGYRWSRLADGLNDFPIGFAKGAAEESVIPFIIYDLREASGTEKLQFSLSDIINGKADHLIKDFAKQCREFGEQYGGFFIRTMREMNLTKTWPPWGGMPNKFKKAWKHMWHIFNEEGANEYATWVWNPTVSVARSAQYANNYYPGDTYVDWIGLDGYNFGSQIHHEYRSFSQLFSFDYSTMRKEHPSKPIIIVETGKRKVGKECIQVCKRKISRNKSYMLVGYEMEPLHHSKL